MKQALIALALALIPCLPASEARAATTLPILWEAGGLSAGNDSVGQAARIAADPAGNLAIVSGPAGGRNLAVTSYTAGGTLRWQVTVSPASGVFIGDWVAAAPNGDFVAVGHPISGSTGQPLSLTLIRIASDGTLLWRVDLARTLPSVGRLLVDGNGIAYLAFNSLGDGQDMELHAYSPSGSLLWARSLGTEPLSNDIATSLALSPDGTQLALVGGVTGGAEWITALFDAATGDRPWLWTSPEGITARDAVITADHVFVVGQGNVGIDGFLSVIALDRATGSRTWRTDAVPADADQASGSRIVLRPDGTLVVAGQALRGFLDWYVAAFDLSGTLLWDAVRDGGLATDEVPASILALADGTTVVSGPGGPPLPGGYIQGVTAGYSSDGSLVWEGFSRLATTWVTTPGRGDVCATGGYDGLVTCFRPAPVRIGAVPDGRTVPGQPLRVTREAGGIALSWGPACEPAAADYAVFAGPLARPFSQHEPVACSTGGVTSARLDAAAGSSYYLVAAHDGVVTGDLGFDSLGQARLAGPAPCHGKSSLLGCR